MSPPARLMICIAMALLVCLAFDGGYWHAVGKVDTEIRARLAVSARTVENAVAEGLGEEGREPLESLAKELNEDRHLRASLVDNASAAIMASTPLSPSEPAPRWSYRLLASISMIARVDIPSPSSATLLETDAHNEIGEASSDIVHVRRRPSHMVRSIRDAVGKLQKDVRFILRRLRPATLLDLGPGRAVDDPSARKIGPV
jgi:two-component system, NarL family, sensor histidine kinase UhpB